VSGVRCQTETNTEVLEAENRVLTITF
jgi:hypothetical protein